MVAKKKMYEEKMAKDKMKGKKANPFDKMAKAPAKKAKKSK